jgi:hypothetical protein
MKLTCIGLMSLLVLAGCRQQTAKTGDLVENPALKNSQAQGDPASDSPGRGASGWIQEKWEGAVSSGGQTVQDSSAWLESLYQSARDQGLTSAKNMKDWVTADFQSQGDWEYLLLGMDTEDSAAVEIRLNELGKSRWECFHITPHEGQWTLFLKRPKRSYLSRVPLRDLANVLPILSADADGK